MFLLSARWSWTLYLGTKDKRPAAIFVQADNPPGTLPQPSQDHCPGDIALDLVSSSELKTKIQPF